MTMTAVLNGKYETTDTIPEFFHYEDTGCEVSDACLECPLPQCKFDDPLWFRRNQQMAKDFQMMYAIQQERLTIEEAAERFSVTIRTVFRTLQRCREAMAESRDGRQYGAYAA